jgi:hypothetical protein
MTDEHRMEQLSRAYVQAIAAVCGCTSARPEPDYGVDLTLRQVQLRRGRWQELGPILSIQLKSTTAPAAATNDHVVYDLDVRAYDLLRRSTRTAPWILILLLLPPDRTAWVDHTEDRLELRRCAYYLSLRRRPEMPNTATVRVQIPRRNQFTPASLERIMEAIQNREDV